MLLENLKFAYELRNHIPQILTDWKTLETVGEMICRHIGGARSSIAITKTDQARPIIFATTGYSEADLSSYNRHYAALNPWVPHHGRLKLGSVRQAEELLSYEQLTASEFFADWLRPMGQADSGLGMRLAQSESASAFLFLSYCATRPESDRSEIARLLKVVGIEIGRALDFRLLAKLQDDARMGLLSQSGNAMLLMRSDGTVINCNAPAEDALRRNAFATIAAGGKLRLADSTAQSQFAATLQALRNGPIGEYIPLIRTNAGPGGAPYLFLTPAPVNLELGPMQTLLPARVLAMILDPAEKVVPPRKMLRNLYNLTAAEAAVAAAVGSGETFDEFAVDRSLSKFTVRNQARSAMAKIGVSRQSELVAVVQKLSQVSLTSAIEAVE